ncbi:hypothetical protein AMTRI_Chr12g239090 [Amborella trichopoda]
MKGYRPHSLTLALQYYLSHPSISLVFVGHLGSRWSARPVPQHNRIGGATSRAPFLSSPSSILKKKLKNYLLSVQQDHNYCGHICNWDLYTMKLFTLHLIQGGYNYL